MTRTHRFLLAAAAVSLCLATGLGAYGTHGLQGSISASAWSAFETAVAYQFYHSLGLLGAALIAERNPDSKAILLGAWLLLSGVVLFCGSIYATSFGAPAAIGSVAPLGGTAFMLGWLSLAVGIVSAR